MWARRVRKFPPTPSGPENPLLNAWPHYKPPPQYRQVRHPQPHRPHILKAPPTTTPPPFFFFPQSPEGGGQNTTTRSLSPRRGEGSSARGVKGHDAVDFQQPWPLLQPRPGPFRPFFKFPPPPPGPRFSGDFVHMGCCCKREVFQSFFFFVPQKPGGPVFCVLEGEKRLLFFFFCLGYSCLARRGPTAVKGEGREPHEKLGKVFLRGCFL